MMFFLLTLLNISQASDNTISVGLGPYYGGIGISYIYEPIVGLGIQAGAGLGGLAMGARWQPEWLSGGYSQIGLARIINEQYAPNFAVGKKFGKNTIIIDANVGIGIQGNGGLNLFLDVGAGCNF